MGGSGGGDFFFGQGKPPEEIVKKIRLLEEEAFDASYEAQIADILREVLVKVNDRDVDTIQQHLKTIKDAIHTEIEGTIDLRYGGSVAKHTYVDGLSDIDSLAIINNSELSSSSPNVVKQYLYQQICKRLPRTEVTIGKLAVTVKFSSGYEIQILPAVRDKSGIKIASSRLENEWSKVIKPEKFALALRYSNTSMNGKLIPVIKLAKSIISSFGESRRISGYHAECLAVEVFSRYGGEKNPKAMLKHFFQEGSKEVLNPIKDKTGQSVHVDEYLGASNSINRKMIADSMSTVARRMQNADGSREKRIWEQLLK